MRHDGADKLAQRDHCALDVKMRVNETRGEERAFQVNSGPGLVIAETNDSAVVDGHVGAVDFTAHDVNDLGVLKNELGRFFAARDAQLLLKSSHATKLRTFCQARRIAGNSGSARASRAGDGALAIANF